MSKVRISVIGAGSWAVSSHLATLMSLKDRVELVGVCRKGRPELDAIKESFGFTLASEDYAEVLREHVDAVIVASPPALHFEHALAALQLGAHVLVEKPFTLSANDAWELTQTACSHGLEIVVAFGWNYLPMVCQAAQLLESAGVGNIEHVSIQMASPARELLSGSNIQYLRSAKTVSPDASTWTNPNISGGGYGQAQLSHALGLALWLTRLRAAEVVAFMGTWAQPGIELHDAIGLRFTNGAVGTVAGGSCHLGAGDNKFQLEVRVIGSDGQLHLDFERELIWHWHKSAAETRLTPPEGAGTYECSGPVNALVNIADNA